MPRLKAGTALRSPRGVVWIYACREGRRSVFSREVFHLLVRPNARPLHLAESAMARWTRVEARITIEDTGERMNESSGIIPGLHVVEQTGVARNPVDPAKPWRLVMELSPPQFMQIAFCMLHGGTERIDVQGDTREALEELIRRNDFTAHPRLRKLTLTGPEGVVLRKERT